jgi:hypothetical protein
LLPCFSIIKSVNEVQLHIFQGNTLLNLQYLLDLDGLKRFILLIRFADYLENVFFRRIDLPERERNQPKKQRPD